MNMKPAAVLVAGLLAAPAFAQSNVTLYGRADYGLMSRGGSGGATPDFNGKTEFASGIAGPSRIGFRGSEDLGNGLKAIFEIEYGTAIDQGTTTSTQWGNRHSWVGLSGTFGTVIGGRIDGLRNNGLYFKYDPFKNVTLGNFGQMTPQLDRYDNSVMYISPSFSGFSGSLAYSTQVRGQEGATPPPGNTHGGNDGDNRLMAALVNYAHGPVSLSASYEVVHTQGVENSQLWFATFGAAYDFKVVKLSALYDTLQSDNNNTLYPGQDQTSWMVGVTAPVGTSIDLRAMYGQTAYDEYQRREADKLDASKWAVGADYKLSKRTYFYADYGSIDNDANGFNTLGPLSTSYRNGYGVRGFDVGLAHKF